MKISLYSNREFKKRNTGWFKDGFNIEYTRNNLIKEDEGNKHYYTLSFKYTFRYDNDTVYFAYSVPYTYT